MTEEVPSIMLKDVVENYLVTARFMNNENAPAHQTRFLRSNLATLLALKELYYLEQAPELDLALWKTVRDNIVVGLVKETQDSGNTSVSMHLASEYFKINRGKRFVGFLNCGSGGVKYQLYKKRDKVVHFVGEYRPAQGKKPKPQETKGGPQENREWAQMDKLECGFYLPTPHVSVEILRGNLEAEIKCAPWTDPQNFVDPGEAPDPSKIPTIDIYGFITGKIRNRFEQKSKVEVFDTENAIIASAFPASVKPVTALIGGTKFGPDSYFLPTRVEGDCQIKGARTMYEQINLSRPLGSKKFLAVASLGIGMETSQWVQHRLKPFTFHGSGMNDSSVLEIGTKIIGKYRKDLNQFRSLCDLIQNCGDYSPTIALKSGCLLLWGPEGAEKCPEPHKALQSLFKKHVTLQVHATVVKWQMSFDFDLHVLVGSSTSQLCRQVTSHVREKTEYKHAQFVFCSPDPGVITYQHDWAKLDFFTSEWGSTYGVKPQEMKTLQELTTGLPEQWKNSGDVPELASPMVPLSWSPDKWLLAHDLQFPPDKREQVTAFRASWSFLQHLCGYNSQTWDAVRSAVQVGLRRSTRLAGNTSVAMGFASRYLENNRDQKVVAIGNCGTGGMKMQVYSSFPSSENSDFRVVLVAEYKPTALHPKKQDVRFSKLAVKCRLVKPGYREDGVDIMDLQRQIHAHSADWPDLRHVPMFAFITGPLRDHWESLGSADAKLALQKYVGLAFEPLDADRGDVVRVHFTQPANPCCPACDRTEQPKYAIRPVSELLAEGSAANFFLPSKVEGQVEFGGVARLYEQLGEGSVVAVLSVESSCSRFTMLSSDAQPGDPDDKKYIVLDKCTCDDDVQRKLPGMSSAEKDLRQLHSYLLSEDLISNLTKVVQKKVQAGKKPIIALKAGASLLLEGKQSEQLRALLLEAPPWKNRTSEDHPEVVMVQMASLDFPEINGVKYDVCFPITRSRLCAIAYELLTNLSLVHNSNRKDKPLEFAYVYFGRSRKEVREEWGAPPLPEEVAQLEEKELQLVPLQGYTVTRADVRDRERFLYFSAQKVTTALESGLSGQPTCNLA